MPNVLRKITYARKAGDTWDTEIEITGAQMQEIVIGWGSQKDAASVKVGKGGLFFDNDNSVTPMFEEEGLIRFYVAKNKSEPYTFTTDDLLFEGTIDSVKQSLSSSGNIITLETFNFYEVFFDVEIPYYEENFTFVEHLQNLITELKKAGTVIEWDSANPVLKRDGSTSFPKKTLSLDYTPAFVIVEKLCSTEFTEDGQYYWYLSKSTNGQRKFSVRAKDSTVSGTIDDTYPINNVSIDKGKDAVINFIIYNVGTDLYNNTVEDVTFSSSSIGKYGWKTHYLIEETGTIFSSLHTEEVKANPGSFTFDGNNNLTSVFPSSYPYTFKFDSSITVSSDADFNEQLRIKALEVGLNIASEYLSNTEASQYIVNLNMPFRTDISVGGLYNITLGKIRQFDKQLRVKQITYSLNGITVSLDQDTKDRE